ncbi:uncharacterized protein TEOVI_000053900 [Trypanosoma equiperdum]|uniref:Uncharacterized protein n=1 Tax=Trypanosoma equiperdum TaxID=5694 RepID=A0A1G4I9L5_TRYEQ|nr:hypothetical protein TEOVI_000053900 [Trypanosoma equiperdum]
MPVFVVGVGTPIVGNASSVAWSLLSPATAPLLSASAANELPLKSPVLAITSIPPSNSKLPVSLPKDVLTVSVSLHLLAVAPWLASFLKAAVSLMFRLAAVFVHAWEKAAMHPAVGLLSAVASLLSCLMQ